MNLSPVSSSRNLSGSSSTIAGKDLWLTEEEAVDMVGGGLGSAW